MRKLGLMTTREIININPSKKKRGRSAFKKNKVAINFGNAKTIIIAFMPY
jgi:hypothetical protein